MKIQSKTIENFLKLKGINPVNIQKISKNKYEFEVLGAEKFTMRKFNYKNTSIGNINVIFGHKIQNTFYCDILK